MLHLNICRISLAQIPSRVVRKYEPVDVSFILPLLKHGGNWNHSVIKTDWALILYNFLSHSFPCRYIPFIPNCIINWATSLWCERHHIIYGNINSSSWKMFHCETKYWTEHAFAIFTYNPVVESLRLEHSSKKWILINVICNLLIGLEISDVISWHLKS